MFRLMISSASSRAVHWLIGRPDAAGASQANASIWQRWSAVMRRGAPGRGKSSSRSSTLSSKSGIGASPCQRSRHWRTRSRLILSSRAISLLLSPSAASRMMRARSASCCSPVRRRVKLCNACSASGARTISQKEIARLKKTSVDYVVCDRNDAPLLCIEFDGLQQGRSVGNTYQPINKNRRINQQWRKEIIELKLKIANASLLPFIVVNSQHFQSVSNETHVTIVDGIIGYILGRKAALIRINRGLSFQDFGLTEEEWTYLSKEKQDELVQNYVHDTEIYSELEYDVFAKRIAELRESLNIMGFSVQTMDYPDSFAGETYEQRMEMYENALAIGAKVSLRTPDHGDVSETAWIPNFKLWNSTRPYAVVESIASILVLEKLQKLRNG